MEGIGSCQYEGELDGDNIPYGEGILTWPNGATEKSIWLNGKKHGYCLFIDPYGEKWEGQVKNGDWHGELTVYW